MHDVLGTVQAIPPSEWKLPHVTILCSNDHSHTWSSQPYVGRKPVRNIDLPSVLLFSESSPAPAFRMMRLMNIRAISERRLHDYKQGYLLPAVQTVHAYLVRFKHSVIYSAATLSAVGRPNAKAAFPIMNARMRSFMQDALGTSFLVTLVHLQDA